MKSYMWLPACLVLATGTLLVGCGGDEGSDGGGATTPEATTTPPSTATTTSTQASGQPSPDDVYQECFDALQGSVAERVVERGCAQARAVFEQCTTQALNAPEGPARDAALKACRSAVSEAIDQLRSSP